MSITLFSGPDYQRYSPFTRLSVRALRWYCIRLRPSGPIQVHPTSLVDPQDPTNLSKFLAPESMRGSGGILLDAEGKRFANELTTRSVLTDAIFEAGKPMPGAKKEGEEEGVAPTVAYLVLNEEAADAFGTGVLGFYMSECESNPRLRGARRRGLAFCGFNGRLYPVAVCVRF